MRGNFLFCVGQKHKLVDSSLRTITQYLLKFKCKQVSYDLAIPLLEMCPVRILAMINNNICIRMLIVALLVQYKLKTSQVSMKKLNSMMEYKAVI